MALGKDGQIASQGPLAKILEKDQSISPELTRENEILKEMDYEEQDSTPAKAASDNRGKLTIEEEVAIGHVGWPAREFHRILKCH